jgi:hypothetical protein
MGMRSVIAVGLLLAATTTWGDGDVHPASIPAPDIQVGDSWTYDSIDGYKNVREFTIESRAAEVGADRIVFEWKRTDERASGSWIVNRDLDWIERRSTSGSNVADPFYPSLSFPLSVGKKWSQKVKFVARYEQEKTVEADLEGRVIGWEKVTVPAGTFDALKIEVSGPYKGYSGNFNWKGLMRDVIWYAPEVKRPVRTQYEDTANLHGYYRDYQDLAAYKLH